jgi:hypothetical protein
MNNAENYAAVEVKRKSAKEEAMYELAERGEQSSGPKRNFEKPDKPDDVLDSEKESGKVTTSLGSLPREDLKNVAILMVLCTFLALEMMPFVSEDWRADDRFIAGYSCWIGFREYSIPVKGQGFLYPSRGL